METWILAAVVIVLFAVAIRIAWLEGYDIGYTVGYQDGRALPIGKIESWSIGPDGIKATGRLRDDVRMSLPKVRQAHPVDDE